MMKNVVLVLTLLVSQTSMAWTLTHRTDRSCSFQAVIYQDAQKLPVLYSSFEKDKPMLLHYNNVQAAYSTYVGGTLPLGTPVFEVDQSMTSIEVFFSGTKIGCRLESI
jgi:hypothetical protein